MQMQDFLNIKKEQDQKQEMKALGFWTLLPFCLRWKNEEWTGKMHTGTETLINMEGWPLCLQPSIQMKVEGNEGTLKG